MQINCIISGPTMAASEPPEPPPRNPDRINASLHKLSESKNIKSLDSSVNAIKEKSINNNRPIKPLLSLDNSNNTTVLATTSGAAAAAAAVAATSISTSSSSSATTAAAASSTVSAINVISTTGNAASSTSSATTTTSTSGLLFNKRVVNDLTPSGDSSSPLSSNGSNQTLTSPMTIDNQPQQQQQQQNLRLAYAASKASDSHGLQQQQQQQQIQQLMLQQQNGGQRGGMNTTMYGETIAHQQQQQQQQQLSNGTVNANNSNSIVLNTQSNTLNAAVDKRNANDVCSVVKITNTGTTYSAPAPAPVPVPAAMAVPTMCAANTMKSLSGTTVPLTSRTLLSAPNQQQQPTMTESTLPFLLLATNNGNVNGNANANGERNSCDGNRNDELKFNSFRSNSNTHSHSHSRSHSHSQTQSDNALKLREENERLSAELQRLRKILEYSNDGAVGGAVELDDTISSADGQQGGETTVAASGSGSMPTQQRVDRLEAELRSVKNQLLTMRLERKKLRTDKSELVAQVKQLCASLQEKEQELRDFIRNYQERVRETETNNAKLSGDRDRERFQLLKQARDEAERSLALAQQLNARDMQLQRLQEQLQEARRQLSGCMSDQESLLSFAPLTPPSAASGMLNQMTVTGTVVGATSVGLRSAGDDSGRGNSNSLSAFSGSLSGGSGATVGDRNSCSNDSVLRNNSDRESTGGELNFSDGACDNGPSITVDPDSISLVSSQNMYQFGTPKERSPTLSPLNSAAYSRSVEQLGSPVDSDGPGAVTRKFAPKTGTLSARHGRGGTWGSISRVFARSRNKSKALSADGASEYLDYSWSPLSEETYTEKLRLLREASQLPMERWRATQVVAWLEVALGMPQYSVRCAENVKSGKVLLELNDTELEAGLGLVHPMHRKKLRLAIEEQRRPELVRYPLIAHLGHTWVASEWLPDIGLPQYAEPFLHSLVDARMLDTLSKKELEKFLGVTRKFHQASIVHGIHVLRIVKYDRQTLAMRRVQSDSVDADPIVWTNQRFVRWARSIDLGEYSDNLKDSGVHGGLVVLEPSFSGETMATALGIPPSKNIIRRHLCTEFDALILPARATLGQGIRSGCGIVPITGPGGLQHYATTDRRSSGSLRISAWKGSQSSLSKAFRFNAKPHRGAAGDRSSFGNSTSPTPSYSSSEGGGGIYATIGSQQTHQQQQQQQQQHYHFLPPPTTAPPPVPTLAASANYGPPGHRVSAPPVGHIDASNDPNMLLYEQHRRVKSISDIGVSASQSGGSVGGVSTSSNSPV